MSKERPFYVVSNWKMIQDQQTVKNLCNLLQTAQLDEKTNVIIGCPFPYLTLVKSLLPEHFNLSGLNCYKLDKHGYTGEVTPHMLKDVGANFVLLGHSDRRLTFNETDDLVGEKAASALASGLSVLICIGENFVSHTSGNTESVLAKQLSTIKNYVKDWSNVLLIYEPIWTIGTGIIDRPPYAQKSLSFIRKWLENHISIDVAERMPLLYGGSVTTANCLNLAKQPDVDGFLVGSSSLKEDFVKIINTFKPTENVPILPSKLVKLKISE